jgi:hypothetical protein
MTSVPGGKSEIRIGDWLKEGWSIVKSDIGVYILASLIYNLILVTCVGGLILYGPLTCGMFLMVFDQMKGGKAEVGRLFGAFDLFSESFVAGFIYFLLMLIGGALSGWIIGIVLLLLLQTVFLFTFQTITDQRLGGIEAISMSFDKVKSNFGGYLLFALVLVAIQAAGMIIVIGVLITTPLVVASLAVAYRDTFGLAATKGGTDIGTNI